LRNERWNAGNIAISCQFSKVSHHIDVGIEVVVCPNGTGIVEQGNNNINMYSVYNKCALTGSVTGYKLVVDGTKGY
jgi:hypothetical protein